MTDQTAAGKTNNKAMQRPTFRWRTAEMFRNKQTQSIENCASAAFGYGGGKHTPLETRLLEFMDSFDFYRFVYDSTYRKRLNSLLDTFSDEEFEAFAEIHAHRFTLN